MGQLPYLSLLSNRKEKIISSEKEMNKIIKKEGTVHL